MSKLRPWYDVIKPREDLRLGKPLDASEFAVHLGHVHRGEAHAVYVDPKQFFERTHLTESLIDLSSQMVRRLNGIKVETSAVFNMATQFGGGKTHALAALFHLAKHGSAAKRWKGVESIATKAELQEWPVAKIAVIVGTEIEPVTGYGREGDPQRRTPWGELAWQLGGTAAFARVAQHDSELRAPSEPVLRDIIGTGPVLILIDELMGYVSRARGVVGTSGVPGRAQTKEFIQNLAGVIAALDCAVLCASVPSSSDTEMPDPDDKVDYEAIKHALNRTGKAVSMSMGGEINEIIRRRLFEWDGLPEEGRKTAAAYAEWCRDHAGELAGLSGEEALKSFRDSYPFHPAVISVFERKWSSLPRFQRTRGVLRLLALWVSRVYKEGYDRVTGEALITLGTAPFQDALFTDALFEQLGEPKLRVPVTSDIAGRPESHAARLDAEAVDAIKKSRLHQKAAAAIFLESNGGQSQRRAEATVPEIKTALGGPGFNSADVETVLDGLASSCFYLECERNRYRFGVKPNLNQMLAQSRGNVKPKDIDARIRGDIEIVFKDGAKGVDRKYVPQRSNDVPDRAQLTLVVMGVETPFMGTESAKLVDEIVRSSGTSGRTYKSGLVFILPDGASSAQEAARNVLAWEDIDADEDARSRFDESQLGSLKKSLERAKRDLKESLFRSYRHILLLGKDNKLKPIDLGQITSSSIEGGRIADLVMRELLKLDEVSDGVGSGKLVRYWPPAITAWSIKDARDAFFASPALPRLSNPESIRRTVADGVSKGDMGYARRRPDGGLTLLKKPGESLLEIDVEISDDFCILTAAEAQKLVEPPRLAKLTIDPPRAEIRPGEVAAFGVRGLDQYGQPFAVSGFEWSATGGTIDASGKFVAGSEHGAFSVTAMKDGIDGRGVVQVSPKVEPGKPVLQPPAAPRGIRWSGEVPPQKWMNFYTKVLSKVSNVPGVSISVTFKASPGAEQSQAKIDELRAGLKELSLDDTIGSDG